MVADARRLPESPRLAFASRRAGIRVTVCSMVSDAAIIASVESILRVIPTGHIVVADESAGLFAADVRGISESDAAAGTVLATRFDPVRINRPLNQSTVMCGQLAEIAARFASGGVGGAELHHRGTTIGRLEQVRAPRIHPLDVR